MEVTLAELYVTGEPLNKLIVMNTLPVRVSLFIARLAKEIFEELALIEMERLKLVEKHGQEGEDGQISVSPAEKESYKAFMRDFDELLSQKADIEAAKPLIPKEVDGKTLLMEPSILMALDKFIEVEE